MAINALLYLRAAQASQPRLSVYLATRLSPRKTLVSTLFVLSLASAGCVSPPLTPAAYAGPELLWRHCNSGFASSQRTIPRQAGGARRCNRQGGSVVVPAASAVHGTATYPLFRFSLVLGWRSWPEENAHDQRERRASLVCVVLYLSLPYNEALSAEKAGGQSLLYTH